MSRGAGQPAAPSNTKLDGPDKMHASLRKLLRTHVACRSIVFATCSRQAVSISCAPAFRAYRHAFTQDGTVFATVCTLHTHEQSCQAHSGTENDHCLISHGTRKEEKERRTQAEGGQQRGREERTGNPRTQEERKQGSNAEQRGGTPRDWQKRGKRAAQRSPRRTAAGTPGKVHSTHRNGTGLPGEAERTAPPKRGRPDRETPHGRHAQRGTLCNPPRPPCEQEGRRGLHERHDHRRTGPGAGSPPTLAKGGGETGPPPAATHSRADPRGGASKKTHPDTKALV